jgi:hypothetical protein
VDNFLKMPAFDGSLTLNLVTIAMTFNLAGSYPFFVFGARAELLSICGNFMDNQNDTLFYVITFAIIGTTTFLAFVVTDLMTLFAIVIIVAGNPVIFILPALMNLIIEPELSLLRRMMNYNCILVGLMASVLGLIAFYYS